MISQFVPVIFFYLQVIINKFHGNEKQIVDTKKYRM